MNRVKVAHVGNAVGGVDVHIRMAIKHLDPAIFECVIFKNFTSSDTKYVDKNGGTIKKVIVPFVRNINLFKDLKCFINLIKYFKREEIDIVHAHSTKGGILGRLAAHWCKIPVVFTPNAFSFLSTDNALKKRFYIIIEQFIRRLGGKLIACSSSEKMLGIDIVGFNPANVFVVPNGIEPIVLDKKMSCPDFLPKRYICSVGRPSYQKNIELLIDVVVEIKKTNPHIHLVLLGVGEYSPNVKSVKSKISDLELESNVTLIEWIPREEIFPIISNAQLYITTARYEGLPYSLIESMALGKAAVVTNCPGNIDLIEDGYNGYVVESTDIVEFSKKVNKIILSDTLKETMEYNAFDLFQKNFEIDITINKLEKTYFEILNMES